MSMYDTLMKKDFSCNAACPASRHADKRPTPPRGEYKKQAPKEPPSVPMIVIVPFPVIVPVPVPVQVPVSIHP